MIGRAGETAVGAVGGSHRTPPSLPAPRAGSRSFVLASLRALHLDQARTDGCLAACDATDRPRMATEANAVLGTALRWQERARSLPPKDGQWDARRLGMRARPMASALVRDPLARAPASDRTRLGVLDAERAARVEDPEGDLHQLAHRRADGAHLRLSGIGETDELRMDGTVAADGD
jgi:hypothetical protein